MPSRHLRSRAAAVALLLAAVATPAHAQDPGGVLDMTGMGIYAMEDAVMEAAQETTSSRPDRPRVTPAPASSLTYAPSLARRRANLAAFVEKARQKDPGGAAKLETAFAASDVIGKMAPELAALGLRIDNVADAYAAWWLNAWLASRQRADTPPRSQIAAVRAQAALAMASLPQVANAGDAVKQQVAEAHLIQAMLIGAYIERAKADPDLSSRLARAVRQGAHASGLDLDAMDLTEKGFVSRRTGAIDTGALAQAVAPDAIRSPWRTSQPGRKA